MKDILLSIIITIAAFCQIMTMKAVLLLTLITISILCQIWWLATFLSGIGLLFRSWWMILEPEAMWFEAAIGCHCQGIKPARTTEWERSRIVRAIGSAVLGVANVILSVALLIA